MLYFSHKLRSGYFPSSKLILTSNPEAFPMEKRLGGITILIEGKDNISRINQIFSDYSEIILARQGLPFRDRGMQVISLIVEGTTDSINALTGSLGRLRGIQAKSVLTKQRGANNEQSTTKDIS